MAVVFNNEVMNKAVEIIESNIREFVERIRTISEIGPYKRIGQETPGFPMFKPGNKEFYQYAYYERTLEWYIRDIIVNAVFRELFSMNSIECCWPNMTGVVCSRFNNESIENVYPMEFIVKTASKRMGYRYTDLTDEEAKGFISQYSLDCIVILDWSDSESMHFLNKRIGRNIEKVYSESLRHFFSTFFSDELYHIYYEKALEAVKTANAEIGFQAIPRLSLRYLSSFRDNLGSALCSMNYHDLRYTVLDPNSTKTARLRSLSLSNDDYDILDANFLGNRRYKALLGTTQFAKCYITAEYLYSVFGDGNSFDYTSVVCGYMKSIEQLLYLIMKYALSTLGDETLWIRGWYPQKRPDYDTMARKNPFDRRISQVRFLPQNEKFFDVELGSLVFFLHNSIKLLVSNDGKELIHEYLRQYTGECRNDHFHKDNIEAYNDVISIRNNTILLMYLLLGSVSLSGNGKKDNEILGVIDDTFDLLFKRMIEIPRSVNRFIVQFTDQNETQVRRMYSQEKTIYDEYGSQRASSIRFVTEEKYATLTDEVDVNPDIVIDRDNMPEKVWIIKHSGEREELNW